MTEHKDKNSITNLVTKDTTESDDCSFKEPSNKPKDDYKYVVLMETSGEECESWYYCIRYNGNKENLEYLQKQLESVEWYILDDLSTFDLDLDHFITEQTAKELTKLELNHYFFHRKFDGVLKKIELNLRKKDKNEKKMVKIFDILGYGQIENYIDNEDLDEEDLDDNNSSSEDESEKSSSSDNENSTKTNKNIPTALQKINLSQFNKEKTSKIEDKTKKE
jgi:hypothetical protein